MEFAFLIMPTFALVCGFIDVGMTFFSWNTMQNAVREGTRYAITYQVDSSGRQTTAIKNKVASWAMNLVSASATSASGTAYIDVNFYTQPTSANPNGTLVTGALANASGNIVEVSIKNYPYAFLAPFSGSLAGAFYRNPGSQMTISVYSSDLLGGAPSSGTPSP